MRSKENGIMKTLLFLLGISALLISSASRNQISLNDEEKSLFEMINKYRASKGLNKITLNDGLTRVAQRHAQDLNENRPDQGQCNMHSWSKANTDCESCCYTEDHAQATCMWNKPRELSDYSGNGYEIAHWKSSGATADSALSGWKRSKPHHQLIINTGIWDEKWNAIGIGIVGEYATVWFGNEVE